MLTFLFDLYFQGFITAVIKKIFDNKHYSPGQQKTKRNIHFFINECKKHLNRALLLVFYLFIIRSNFWCGVALWEEGVLLLGKSVHHLRIILPIIKSLKPILFFNICFSTNAFKCIVDYDLSFYKLIFIYLYK